MAGVDDFALVVASCEFVTFKPTTDSQAMEVNITNGASAAVLVKMKCNRPAVYKIQPGLFLLRPGEMEKVSVVYQGLEPGQQPSLKDRITAVVVSTLADSATNDLRSAWQEAKSSGGARKNLLIRVHFEGYPVPEDGSAEDEEDVDGARKSIPTTPKDKPKTPLLPSAIPEGAREAALAAISALGMPKKAPASRYVVFIHRKTTDPRHSKSKQSETRIAPLPVSGK